MFETRANIKSICSIFFKASRPRRKGYIAGMYRITLDKRSTARRRHFLRSSAQMVAYDRLIEGLRDLIDQIKASGQQPGEIAVVITTTNENIWKQLAGRVKVLGSGRQLHAEACHLLLSFGDVKIVSVWRPNDNVAPREKIAFWRPTRLQVASAGADLPARKPAL